MRFPPTIALLNREHPLARGLMFAIPMNEGAGATIREHVGGTSAVSSVTPTWVRRDFGPMIDFGANAAYFAAPHTVTDADLDGPTSAFLIAEEAGNSFLNFLVIEGESGTYHFAFNPSRNGGAFTLKNTPNNDGLKFGVALNDHSWAYTNTGGDIETNGTAYLDGLPYSTSTGKTDASSQPAGAYLLGGIGGNGYHRCGPIYLWRRVLTPEEIWELHNDPWVMFRPAARPVSLWVPGGATAQSITAAPLNAEADLQATTLDVETPLAPLNAEAELQDATADGEVTETLASLDISMDFIAASFNPGPVSIAPASLNPEMDVPAATLPAPDAQVDADPLNPEAELPATSLDAEGSMAAAPLNAEAELIDVTHDIDIPAAQLNPEAELQDATADGEASMAAPPLNPEAEILDASATAEGSMAASPLNPEAELVDVTHDVDIPAAQLNPEADVPATSFDAEASVAAAPLNPEADVIDVTHDVDIPAAQLNPEAELIAAVVDGPGVVAGVPLNPEIELPAAVATGGGTAQIDADPLNPEIDIVAAVVATAGDELWVTKQTLRLVGRRTPTVVPVEIDGDTVLLSLVPHNWIAQVTVESSFLTDVTRSETMREERVSLREKPLRLATFQHTGMSRADSARIMMNMARIANGGAPVPLHCDATRLTQTAGLGAQTLTGDFRWRRFFPGARLVIHTWDASGRPTDVEIHAIEKISADRQVVTLVTTLAAAKASGARVIPLLDCDVTAESSAQVVSDANVDLTITFAEKPGASSLPATIMDVAPWLQHQDGLPILDVSGDWSAGHQLRVMASGERARDGRASVFAATGDAPRFAHTINLNALTRERAWDVIQFFESRRGRARPFWLVAPLSPWTLENVNGTTIKIARVGNIEDVQDFVKHIGFVLRDGTVVIRTVTTAYDNGTHFLIGLQGALPASVTTSAVRRLSPAWRVRMERDAFTERWTTDGICTMRFDAIDVDDEDARVTQLEDDDDRTLLVTRQVVRVLGALS